MSSVSKPAVIISREEERKVLRAQSEKIRKNPKLGVKIAQKAGILDKNGKLTPFYNREV